MKNNEAMKSIALQSIASYLSQCGCQSFGDVIEATQSLIDVAQETRQGYQDHPEALKAETVPAIN